MVHRPQQPRAAGNRLDPRHEGHLPQPDGQDRPGCGLHLRGPLPHPGRARPVYELFQRGLCHPLLCGGPGGGLSPGAVPQGAGLWAHGHDPHRSRSGLLRGPGSGRRQHHLPLGAGGGRHLSLRRRVERPAPLPRLRLREIHRPRYVPLLPVPVQPRRAGRRPGHPRRGRRHDGGPRLPPERKALLLLWSQPASVERPHHLRALRRAPRRVHPRRLPPG